jgi:hypothetical protein
LAQKVRGVYVPCKELILTPYPKFGVGPLAMGRDGMRGYVQLAAGALSSTPQHNGCTYLGFPRRESVTAVEQGVANIAV